MKIADLKWNEIKKNCKCEDGPGCRGYGTMWEGNLLLIIHLPCCCCIYNGKNMILILKIIHLQVATHISISLVTYQLHRHKGWFKKTANFFTSWNLINFKNHLRIVYFVFIDTIDNQDFQHFCIPCPNSNTYKWLQITLYNTSPTC